VISNVGGERRAYSFQFALRERRVHVTQEDFDLATAKVLNKANDKEVSLGKLWK
jgi:26S proteasome regulatory subunit T6